jgi:sucrose phosphorylase
MHTAPRLAWHDADDDRVVYHRMHAGRAGRLPCCETTGVTGSAIHHARLSCAEVGDALQRPLVRRLLHLVRLRNTHPAFDGGLEVETDGGSSMRLRWRHGDASCALEVDLASGRTAVTDARGAQLVPEPI